MSALLGAGFAGRAWAGTAYTDAFTGKTLSSNWSASSDNGGTTGPGGGTTGSSTILANPNVELVTSTAASSVRFIQAAATNYSYVGTTETFQATLQGLASTSALGSGFSIYLVGSGATTAQLTTASPAANCANVIQVIFTGTGAGQYSVQLAYKTNAAGKNPPVVASLPGTFSAANGTVVGFTISNTAAGNASPLTFYCGSVAKTVSLPAGYNSVFPASGSTYLFLMAQTGTGKVATTATFSQFTANGFTDFFTANALAPPNWTGAGGGAAGSSTLVGNGSLKLATGTGNYSGRWIQAAATNYSYVNNTETFEAALSGTTNTSYASGFCICLVGGDATSAQLSAALPTYSAPSVIELYFSAGGDGKYFVGLFGKAGQANANPGALVNLTGSAADMAEGNTVEFPYHAGTVGFTVTNKGAGTNSTLTFYFEPASSSSAPEEPISESYSLPASYNAHFSGTNGAVHLYLMATNGTGANTATFSQFTASAQPVITTNLAVNANATKQTITGLGGNYAKDGELGGNNFADDDCGAANLESLQPTYVRTAIPLDIWETSQQTINPSRINMASTSYWAEQDQGNVHDSFKLLQELQAGGVTHFIFSVWNLASWMYTSSGSNQIADTPAGREAVLGGMATYLIYAHLYYGLDLSKVYLSFNEPDYGTGPWLSAQEYADIVTDANTYLASFTASNGTPYFASTNLWVVGDTCAAGGGTGVAPPHGPLIGSATPTGYTSLYTSTVVTDVENNNGGSSAGVAALGYHSWDTFLDPSVLNQISAMGSYYGLPVFSPEVGQVPDLWESNDKNIVFAGWDWGRTLATTYQKVLNYSGASVAMIWEYMDDFGLRDETDEAYPYPSYYLVNQMVTSNFPEGSVILGSSVTGNTPGSPGDMEAMAAENSSEAGYATTVQIIQNDFRGVGVFLTGLNPGTTYTVTQWNATNAAHSTNGTGQPAALASITTDSTGAAILNIPPAPIEADVGSTATYVGSGSVVTLAAPP